MPPPPGSPSGPPQGVPWWVNGWVVEPPGPKKKPVHLAKNRPKLGEFPCFFSQANPPAGLGIIIIIEGLDPLRFKRWQGFKPYRFPPPRGDIPPREPLLKESSLRAPHRPRRGEGQGREGWVLQQVASPVMDRWTWGDEENW